MSSPEICDRMRADWNQRARDDAAYYVAFGRRNQTEDEFFETGLEIAEGLRRELKRMETLPDRKAWRSLEIGCGMGRLMRPLSRDFAEVHGVDVSDAMVAQAREKLRGIPNAFVHLTGGADLAEFAAGKFEFVYSYAVFQHIPSREVVFQYLREASRVLKSGGIFRFQVNGLPPTAQRYDTWSGVRISAAEIREFAREHDFQLLALEGVLTQYMWVTLRKRPEGWAAGPVPASNGPVHIRRITNCHRSEPVVPCRGRFSTASLWLEDLPSDCDLNNVRVLIGGNEGIPSYIGPPGPDGLQQMNVALPPGTGTGLQPVELFWREMPLSRPAFLRVAPPGPLVPRLLSVTDGVDLLSGTRIVSRSIKVGVEEMEVPAAFAASLDGIPLAEIDAFCVDPVPPRYEYNLMLPPGVSAGPHVLQIRVGKRAFSPVGIEVI